MKTRFLGPRHRGTVIVSACLAGLLACAAALPAQADGGDWRIGRSFAIANCRDCHDVGNGRKLLTRMNGPAFRDVANQSATTPLSLKVFFTTSHAPMPNIILSKPEIDNLIAYIMSLRKPAQVKM